MPPLPDELEQKVEEVEEEESQAETSTETESTDTAAELEDELPPLPDDMPPLPDELEQKVEEVTEEEEELEDQTQESIDQELIPLALDNPSTGDIDSELVSKDDLEEKEPEQRIKKLSQDFFQKPEDSMPEDSKIDSVDTTENTVENVEEDIVEDVEENAEELAAKAANSEFSEIPSFGEHLDLSKVPEANPASDELEFPPNPFAEDQTTDNTQDNPATGDTQQDPDNTNPDNKGPGQLPTPDVPEDL
jgi:DNA repair exonuclease SbcCD ATPase subunit